MAVLGIPAVLGKPEGAGLLELGEGKASGLQGDLLAAPRNSFSIPKRRS